jgi:hypothetical protein
LPSATLRIAEHDIGLWLGRSHRPGRPRALRVSLSIFLSLSLSVSLSLSLSLSLIRSSDCGRSDAVRARVGPAEGEHQRRQRTPSATTTTGTSVDSRRELDHDRITQLADHYRFLLSHEATLGLEVMLPEFVTSLASAARQLCESLAAATGPGHKPVTADDPETLRSACVYALMLLQLWLRRLRFADRGTLSRFPCLLVSQWVI